RGGEARRPGALFRAGPWCWSGSVAAGRRVGDRLELVHTRRQLIDLSLKLLVLRAQVAQRAAHLRRDPGFDWHGGYDVSSLVDRAIALLRRPRPVQVQGRVGGAAEHAEHVGTRSGIEGLRVASRRVKNPEQRDDEER